MTKEEAEKYAKNMTYCEAIHNLKQAKSVPYRKATFTKINELLDELEQEPCEDAVSRAEVIKIAKEMYLEVANMELDVKTISDCISYTASKCREVLERKLQALSSVTPQEPKTGYISIDDVMSVFDDFMCGEVDEEGTETFLEMLKDKAGK